MQIETWLLNHFDLKSSMSRLDSRQVLKPGGKSGLHRVKCQVTPGRCESTESATENIPPV